MSESSPLPPAILEQTPWHTPQDPIHLASSLTLRRNLSAHLFPHKLSHEERSGVTTLIKEALLASPHVTAPIFLNHAELASRDKEMILEHFLLQGRNMGEASVIDQSGEFLALINNADHLFLQQMIPSTQWQERWERLNRLEESLSPLLNYAFHQTFGYLTCDPNFAGTALEAKAYLHLPLLVHLDQLDECVAGKFALKSIKQIPEGYIGDLVILENRQMRGQKEEDLLRNLFDMAEKLTAREGNLRKEMKSKPSPQLHDKIARAFGLLTNSTQLHAKETLDSISLLLLGLDLDAIKGVERSQLFDLYFLSRRAHLIHHLSQDIKPEDLPHSRSDLLHKTLEGATLHI